jgi:hypothetical protein
MRYLLVMLGSLSGIFGIGILTGAFFTYQAVQEIGRSSAALCLTQRDRDKVDAGWFSPDRQDRLVVNALNSRQGHAKSGWWHIRGMSFGFTYRLFWSPSQRAAKFQRLVASAEPCPRSSKQ